MKVNVVYTMAEPEPASYRVNVIPHFTASNTASADVEIGTPYTVDWTVLDGYHFVKVEVNGEPWEDTPVTVSEGNAVSGVVTVEIFCEKDEPAEPDPTEPVSYTVTANRSGNGAVSIDGDDSLTYKTLNAPGTATVTWTADEGWRVKNVTLNGADYRDESGNIPAEYEFVYAAVGEGETDTNADAQIFVEFEPMPEYNVNVTKVGNGGDVSGAGVMTYTESSREVTWSAAEGWHLASVSVDGVMLPDALAQLGRYTVRYSDFSDAEPGRDVTLKVVFEKDEVKQFNITVVAATGGTVDSAASATLSAAGESFEAEWSADTGYHVTDVLLNNVSISAAGSYVFDYDDMLLSGMPTENLLELHFAPDEPVKGKFLVSTSLTPSAAGSISSSAIVEEGDSHTVTWSVGTGYTFKSVTLDGVEVTPDIDSGSGEYSYVLRDVRTNHSVAVTCEQAGGSGGGDTGEFFDIVTGVSNGTFADGKTTRSIHKGEDYSLSWTPNPGFFIESVTVDGENKGAITSYTFTNITADHTVEVVCKSLAESNLYYVNVSVVDESVLDGNGKPTPSGGAVSNGNRELTVGSDHTVSWAALSGYQITKVTVSRNDGEAQTVVSGESGGTYNVTGAAKDDHILVEITVKPKDEGVYHDIIVSSVNATVTGNTRVKEGESTTISWEPEIGYAIKSIVIDDSARAVTLESYTFRNVTADHNVTVICERLDTEKEYVITTHITDGGSISEPVTVRTAEEKESQTISWAAPAGFVVDKVKIDGVIRNDLVSAGSYTFTDIEDDHSVDVECKIPEVTTYNITASNDNGSISAEPSLVVSGGDSTVTWRPATGFKLDSVTVTNGVKTGGGILRYGTASHTVTWAPSSGFQVKSVTVDNVPVPESMLQPNGGSYTFNNIVADHSVVVVCEKTESGESRKYYLEANIVNGLFDPDSLFGVYLDPAVRDGFAPGENFEISWAANEGYKMASVELDGVSRPDLAAAGKLSLIGIRGDHALSVVCIDESEDPVVREGPFTITTAINHGTISEPFTTTEEQNYYTVTWTADEAYEVVNVLVDGNPYANWADGYITFNPITANHTVDVYAQLREQPGEDEYVIDVMVDNGGAHDVTVDGNSVTVVRKGSSAVASWQAAEGYDVSRIVIDGVSYTGLPGCTAAQGSYSFSNVSADHRIVVYTTKHVDKDPVYYSISVLPYGDPNNVELTAEADGQSGRSLVAVLEGSEASVKWNAKAGWKIDKVTRNDNIMSDAEVAAGMSEDGFQFTVNSNNNFVVYISEVTRVDESFLTVITQITNGTISSGCSVKKGESVEVSWLPNNGYEMTQVEITTELVDADGNVSTQTETYTDLGEYRYALNNIQGNTIVSVSCEKTEEDVAHSYQIRSEVTNGTVSRTGTVLAGESRMLIWMPAEGCTVSSVELYKVDDAGNILSEVDISDRNGNSFTIDSADANYLLVLICENEGQSDTDFLYDINTAITNGTINGPFLNLRKNGGALVEWMPNDGYHVKELRVDGVTKPIPADYALEIAVEGGSHGGGHL